MECPFSVGSLVEWSPDVPKTWRFIWTPGPMTVISSRWHHGKPSEYAKMFGESGMNIKPGWIVLVEYDADASGYRDPPLSLYLGSKTVQKEIHQMWLVPAT